MKNLIGEKPTDQLHGRTLYITQFVADSDIKDKKVLDIGCGFGWLELNFLQRGAGRITGIEISEKNLETARKYIKSQKVFFRVGSAVDLPFESQSFDTVVSWDVMEHIPKNSETRMFQEVSRVLKGKGIFYLSVPYDSFFSKIFDPAWWLIGHRHYTKRKLISLAKENGYISDKIITNGGWWELLGINNLYISKWIFRRKPFFEKFINNKQDIEYKKEKGFTSIFVRFKKLNTIQK